MLTGQNGILTQAQNAKEKTEISSEKEAIQLTLINKESTNDSKYDIGEELRDRTLSNGYNWKIVSVNNTKQVYGTGYYYVGKGTNLESYGETKHEWVINYDTGEVIELPEEGYTKLAYGDNLAITEGMILNVDPINMENSNSWGDGVKVYGIQEGDGFGWNETEFKLDGVDDYMEIYTGNNSVESGFTFEFYGKNSNASDRMSILSKALPTPDKAGLRSYIEDGTFFKMSMGYGEGGIIAESDWQNPNLPHWIDKNIEENFLEGGYITISVDLNNNMVTLYKNGAYLDSTKCSNKWLNKSELNNKEVPFLIGKYYSYSTNGVTVEHYSKIDLYACRLYNKVLTSDEVKANYDKTVTYHNVLVQSQKEDGEN